MRGKNAAKDLSAAVAPERGDRPGKLGKSAERAGNSLGRGRETSKRSAFPGTAFSRYFFVSLLLILNKSDRISMLNEDDFWQ